MPVRARPSRLPRVRRRLLRGAVVLALALVALRLTGCMEGFFYYPAVEPTPPPLEFRGAEGVWFESADGTRLYGWFIPAQGLHPAGASAPTILHVHGNAGNISSHVGFTEHLPAAGFNVFIFDYRGYGQSEGSVRRRGPLIEDTHAALDVLLARDGVDPQRIGMYAQSLGGAIGLNVMADRPEIAAAVVESPFASWRDVAASAVSGDPPGWLGRLLAGLFISDAHRPLDAIARIDRPILLLHGDADRIVPVSHSRRLAGAAGASSRLVVLPGGDHNTLRQTHPEADEMMIAFFSEHLADPRRSAPRE